MFYRSITAMNTRRSSLYAVLFLLLGIALSTIWFSLKNPMRPLYVELLNDTDATIPSVVIEHGSANLQQKISLVQLKPHESRIVALNHQPGMGFNVAANFANGEKTEICGGKSKDHWFFRETITKFGIYTTPVR